MNTSAFRGNLNQSPISPGEPLHNARLRPLTTPWPVSIWGTGIIDYGGTHASVRMVYAVSPHAVLLPLSSQRKAQAVVAEIQQLDDQQIRLSTFWISGVGLGISCPNWEALLDLTMAYEVELEQLALYHLWIKPGTLVAFEQPETIHQLVDLFGLPAPQSQRSYFNGEAPNGHR